MKKTVTPAVLEANRINAKKSTGPRRTDTVKHNAIKHGLLTKVIRFKNEQEESEFKKFRHELRADRRPEGAIETMLVEEVAMCWWKLRTATDVELKEFKARRNGAKAAVEAYVEQSEEHSYSDWQNHLQSAARSGCEVREMTLRVGGSDTKAGRCEEPKEAGMRQFEVKLGSAAESGMRYRNAWKKDLYKALEVLTTLQNGRKGRGQS
jgi:hypothetical protein